QLQNYDDPRYDVQWLVDDVWHYGSQPQSVEEFTGSGNSGYSNKLHASPRDHVFKTQPVAPKPKIRGSQTAFVTGPKGEEIYCDKYGRVKVQFHWDRDGKYDENSSCWVRVRQPLAGNKWGDLLIPRIGTEVLVKFVNGDPDQPIIMGCLYNGKDKPPYKLPDHKTRTTFKTNSSPGGDGFNEIRLEDKKGNEEVFIHAQKDLDIQVKNDKREHINNERHLNVDNCSYEHLKGKFHQKIDGNYNLNVNKDIHTIINDCLHSTTGIKYSIQAGNEIHIKAGDKIVFDAGVEMTLKGGGSQAKINPSGVHFTTPKLKIKNGTPGSGSGLSIQEPNVAVEADRDKAGEEPFAPPEQKEALKNALGWDMICEECVKQKISDENTDIEGES
ncbi:type VI secretion system tip protein TssI/VgrG, partial [Spartinivicinus poritis]